MTDISELKERLLQETSTMVAKYGFKGRPSSQAFFKRVGGPCFISLLFHIPIPTSM